MPALPRSRLAVLIDAASVPAPLADDVFAAVADLGEPIVRRIYGDFASPALGGWHRAMARHALTARQAGGGAAGVALAVDAIDLLHAGAVDGFCLASGLGDFSPLAVRIREQGLEVHGLGGPASPEGFREACRGFTVLGLPQERPSRAVRDPAPLRQAATMLVRRALLRVRERDGWRHLSPVGKALRDISPNFDPRHFGHARLLDLVADTGAFEVTKRQGRVLVRPRDEG